MNKEQRIQKLLEERPDIVREWNMEQIREWKDFINWDFVSINKRSKDFVREFKDKKYSLSTPLDIMILYDEHGKDFANEIYRESKLWKENRKKN